MGQSLGDRMDNTAHTTTSSAREKLIEHLFIGELLRHLWLRGVRDAEVLRAEVDCAGFDLVMECFGVLRHIQLKTSHKSAKTKSVTINIALSKKPSGCVLWLFFDDETLELRGFRWLGGEPGQRLPALGEKIARHSKANGRGEKTARPQIREVKKSAFRCLNSMEEVVGALFGQPASIVAAP